MNDAADAAMDEEQASSSDTEDEDNQDVGDVLLSDAANRRAGHVTFVHEDRVMVWGGYEENHDSGHSYWPTNELLVYFALDRKWVKRRTSGQAPPRICGSAGAVLGDKLYVFGGFYEENIGANSNDTWILDLVTFEWQDRGSPAGRVAGTPPLRADKLVAWPHRNTNKVYVFGGFGPLPDDKAVYPKQLSHVVDQYTVQFGRRHVRGWNNQLAALDVATLAWEWPRQTGTLPEPRAAHTAVCSGDDVFIFGGRYLESRRNDLYHLDLRTMNWSMLNPQMPLHMTEYPQGRSWHTLTLLPSSDCAVLCGGYSGDGNGGTPVGDCWTIDLKDPLGRTKVMNRWTRRRHLEDVAGGPRLWHATAALGGCCTGEILVIGGVVNDLLNRSGSAVLHGDRIVRLNLAPKTLLSAAMDFFTDNPALFERGKGALPRNLQTWISERIKSVGLGG